MTDARRRRAGAVATAIRCQATNVQGGEITISMSVWLGGLCRLGVIDCFHCRGGPIMITLFHRRGDAITTAASIWLGGCCQAGTVATATCCLVANVARFRCLVGTIPIATSVWLVWCHRLGMIAHFHCQGGYLMIAPFLCWGVWLGSLHQVSTTLMVSRQLLPVVGVEGSATSQVTSTNNVQS